LKPRRDVRHWRPPGFTARVRGYIDQPPPLERWEALLRAERSTAHRVVEVVARAPGLRRLLRVPARFAEPPATSVAERERRVNEARRTRLGRALRWLRGRPSRRVQMPAARPGERPKPGPLVHREIDAAIDFLRMLPFEELQERGWHLQPNQFLWPLNDLEFLRANPELWNRRKTPPGIDWDVDSQYELAVRLRQYAPELDDVPEDRRVTGEFTWSNAFFAGGDAYIYYGVVRELRPKRVIEIGAGWSTLLLRRALEKNGEQVDVTVVEPYPSPGLLGRLPPEWRVVRNLVQHADPSVFEELGPGDLVFYDGSHCVRTASDVNWMLFEVMPRLAKGVWVHFHDIFWPRDYHEGWILDDGLSWNEQYFLQAFLMHSDSWRVRIASEMLRVERGDELGWMFQEGYGGGSVWLERIAD
jgi:hypothetical protein